MRKPGGTFFYWFWRILSAGIGILIGNLVNPATWGLTHDMNKQEIFLAIRIALILIVYFVLSSFVKKSER